MSDNKPKEPMELLCTEEQLHEILSLLPKEKRTGWKLKTYTEKGVRYIPVKYDTDQH